MRGEREKERQIVRERERERECVRVREKDGELRQLSKVR